MDQQRASVGALIRRYGKSRSFLFAWWSLATLFAGVGVFVLALIPRIGKNGLNFSGDVSILYATGLGGLAIGVLLAVLPWLLVRSQPTYYLHEHAVRSVGPKGDRTDFYRDIEDLYIFQYGGFAYRANEQAPWCSAGARISGFADLTQRLRNLHAQHRVEQLYRSLVEGRTVSFRCLSDQVASSKSMVASRNMNHPMHLLELSRDTLSVRGKSLPIQRLADIQHNGWTEKLNIMDTDRQVFHRMHPTAVMSFDVMYQLLARLKASGT